MSPLAFIISILLAICCISTADEKPIQKKLLFSGSAVPSRLEQFQTDAAALEGAFPFDGLVIRPILTLERDGRPLPCDLSRVDSTELGNLRLEPKDLQAWSQALSRLRFARLQSNFIAASSAAFPADWFDEDSWNRSLTYFVNLADVASQTGCRGILLDTGVANANSPFAFRPLGGRTLQQVRQQVQRRGHQWIEAIAKKCPQGEIFFTTWLNGLIGISPENDLYLLADFAKGVLEAAPSTIRLIDGNGQMHHHSGTELPDCNRPAASLYLKGAASVPRNSRESFFRVSSLALPIDLGYHSFDTAGCQRFLDTLTHCVECTDEYVLITDFSKISPPPTKKYPYLKEMLQAGLAPLEAAQRFAGKENLLHNGGFAASPAFGKAEPDTVDFGAGGWFAWQDKRKKAGHILLEKEGVAFRGILKGSIVQPVNIQPGRYLLTARARSSSETLLPQLSCNFRDKRNLFITSLRGNAFFGPPDSNGWRQATAIIDVPANANINYMTVTAGVSGSNYPVAQETVCHFSEATLRRIAYPWNKQVISVRK